MNNSNVANYDERSASNNILHHTSFFLDDLCIGILENKSFQFLPSTWVRYNITDKHLFLYISVPFSFKSPS